ncbi:hypothetical protein [Haloprofundus halobius]|uniref:hypothetical protein n=1 Tax=Haloprofundus halobius TaxID=2876194 RepID=UPI001CCD2E2E|nr:hypothetical protein [Haloprofundus halobius]
MSFSATPPKSDRLSERIEAGIDRVNSATDSQSELTGTAKELFDVLVATEMLLESIDLERLRHVVDIEQLPTIVDFDRLADAIREHDPDLAFDLSNVEQVVDRRELWASVDLLGVAKAKRRLESELEDLPGSSGSFEVDSDSQAAEDAEAFVSSLRSEAREVTIQQEFTKKLEVARRAVVQQHVAFERLYASEEMRSRNPSERQRGRNPTAVSLRPSGPLADGVSTRVSTVPAAVPYSKIDALPRIYGRRWRTVKAERRR